jgi:hypothetical protein
MSDAHIGIKIRIELKPAGVAVLWPTKRVFRHLAVFINAPPFKEGINLDRDISESLLSSLSAHFSS